MDTINFKKTLLEKGVSQNKLATLLNVSPKTLCEKINGKKRFYVDEAFKICDILGIEDIKEYFG